MKTILEMVQEYQVALQSLCLKSERVDDAPHSVVEAALRIAAYRGVVVMYAKNEARKLLLVQKKVLAIKVYKNIVGCSLLEAKNVVDQISTELQYYAKTVEATYKDATEK